jgi:three-Cys-motif partner protein
MVQKFDKFLLPEDDGLPTRPSQRYARDKLRAVETYIKIVNTAMREKPWRDRYYIDLFAGPGKNKIGDSVELGSPLIALVDKHGFTKYRFNEEKQEIYNALQKRVEVSPRKDSARIYQRDANQVVDEICTEIEARNTEYIEGVWWHAFNIAFLDPEGLELHWTTVERLAQITKMDLIINFSTSGILRSLGAHEYQVLDRFFGTKEWRTAYVDTDDATAKRRKFIDFYLGRLQRFGYYTDIDDNYGIPFKNSKNVQVYSLIFACKDELGYKLWREGVKSSSQKRRLPGFE